MANTFFKFKKITVHQDKCAMKVCTDSCLFGAYLANYFEQIKPDKILDIGTGTGLLSLMVAQKIKTTIEAVEINEDAFMQAKENFHISLWNDRLHIYLADVRYMTNVQQYDLIMCNPPFYKNSLHSPHKNINQARHGGLLSLKELITVAESKLKSGGYFSVMLSHNLGEKFTNTAFQHNLFLNHILEVSHLQGSKHIRAIMIFSREKSDVMRRNIFIKNDDNGYSIGFKNLLKDYYLAF